jgi:hypothetical protein
VNGPSSHHQHPDRYQHPAAALDADIDAMFTALPASVKIPDQVDAILNSVSREQPLVSGRALVIRRWSRLVIGAAAVGLSVVAILTAAWLPEISGHADSQRPVAGFMKTSQHAASVGFGGLEAFSNQLGTNLGLMPAADQPEASSEHASLSRTVARTILLPAAGLDQPLMLGHFEQDGPVLRLVLGPSDMLTPQMQTQMQLVGAIAESAWDRARELTRTVAHEGSDQAANCEPQTFADLLSAAVDVPQGTASVHPTIGAVLGGSAAGQGASSSAPPARVYSFPPH